MEPLIDAPSDGALVLPSFSPILYYFEYFIYFTDILTMKSVKGTGATASYQARDDHDGLFRNEADFEAFALQFPIDDSISELFAFTSDSERKSTLPKFISVRTIYHSYRSSKICRMFCLLKFSNGLICIK